MSHKLFRFKSVKKTSTLLSMEEASSPTRNYRFERCAKLPPLKQLLTRDTVYCSQHRYLKITVNLYRSATATSGCPLLMSPNDYKSLRSDLSVTVTNRHDGQISFHQFKEHFGHLRRVPLPMPYKQTKTCCILQRSLF